MNDVSILKSDIFFFVSTISVVFISALLLVGLIYIVSILRTIRSILKTAKTGAEAVVEGLNEAKSAISKNGFASSVVANIVKKLFQKRKNH